MPSENRNYPAQSVTSMGSISEPDILCFSEYFESWRGSGGDIQPEKRLMLAILLDAVECFQKTPVGKKLTRQIEDTEQWIFMDDREWAFSFINICESVGMDPQYLRGGLVRWKQRTLAQPHPVPQTVGNMSISSTP